MDSDPRNGTWTQTPRLGFQTTAIHAGQQPEPTTGAVVVRDPELGEPIDFVQNAAGAVPGPFDAWLTLRGIKTLGVRMDRHCSNALTVARFLDEHLRVRNVLYPGLETHPQHELARRQMRAFGGMVSVVLDGGLAEARRSLSAFATQRRAGSSVSRDPAPTRLCLSPDCRPVLRRRCPTFGQRIAKKQKNT